jgi:hypothetical protein
MKHRMCIAHASSAVLAIFAGAAVAQPVLTSPATDPALDANPRPALRAPFLLVPEAPRLVVDPETGEGLLTPVHHIWKPVCGTPAGSLSIDDLRQMDATHQAAFADGTTIVDTQSRAGGFNIVYVLAPSVPAAARPAFAAAEAYIERKFSDPITVTITVSFARLGAGVLGGTASSFLSASYATSRARLVAGADPSDSIQRFLPATPTIPVRYSTTATSSEDRVFWTVANYNAAVGPVAGNAAAMQFSTNFAWDFDPANGVPSTAYSFQDVVIHETGHALGFDSGVDFRNSDIEALDLFRFRRTDGTASADFNPDTTAEFTIRPRWAVFNNPNDDVNSDIISGEFPMSDGSPNQASHFRDQTPPIGIMDPTLGFGQTFYPEFFRTPDLVMLDAIGYDR